MSGHNDLIDEQQGAGVLVLTATKTLTHKHLAANKIIRAVHSSVQINLTLPTATANNAGMVRLFNCGGAAVLTVVTEGFGGSGSTTVTLAQGETIVIVSDGTGWYASTLATGDIH